MKLRYYLRGLGIGILVTVLIMGAAGGKEEKPLSDAQIRERAIELGMVDSSSLVLSDLARPGSKGQGADEQESGTQGSGGQGSGELTDKNGDGGEQTVSDGNGDTYASPAPISQGTVSSGNGTEVIFYGDEEDSKVSFEIEKGINSYRICVALEEAGLIEDAAAFDTFLCENGYSKSMRAGTYKIPMGATEEEILRIITGKK